MLPDLFITMAMTGWKAQNKRLNDFLAKLSDEELMLETAPGRNRGIYLLGHLAAVNDNLFTLLGVGERMHPELDAVFLKEADRSGLEMPSAAVLRKYWDEINERLYSFTDKLTTGEWFERHTAVSEADFGKEPHRNRLNIILGRTTHHAYHLGPNGLPGKKIKGALGHKFLTSS